MCPRRIADQFKPGTVRHAQFARDEKTQASASIVRGEERLEYLLALRIADAFAIIDNMNLDLTMVPGALHANSNTARLAPGMPQCIAQQIP
jgi:hypothetical protein